MKISSTTTRTRLRNLSASYTLLTFDDRIIIITDIEVVNTNINEEIGQAIEWTMYQSNVTLQL